MQPPLIYLIVRKPKVSSIHWWASQFCIFFGLIVTIFGEQRCPVPLRPAWLTCMLVVVPDSSGHGCVGSIGGLYGIITDAKG
jgi:hypothetical protein